MDLGEIKKGFLRGKGRNGLWVKWGFGGERDGKWSGGDENKAIDIVVGAVNLIEKKKNLTQPQKWELCISFCKYTLFFSYFRFDTDFKKVRHFYIECC